MSATNFTPTCSNRLISCGILQPTHLLGVAKAILNWLIVVRANNDGSVTTEHVSMAIGGSLRFHFSNRRPLGIDGRLVRTLRDSTTSLLCWRRKATCGASFSRRLGSGNKIRTTWPSQRNPTPAASTSAITSATIKVLPRFRFSSLPVRDHQLQHRNDRH